MVFKHEGIKVINRFVGTYKFLSNFHPSPMIIDGNHYTTVEHYYQSMKTRCPNQQKRIREAITPGRAKRFGRKCDIREDWEEIKFNIMEKGLRAKFKDIELKTCLLLTADDELIEGNNWRDTIWGVDLKTGKGKNFLGRLLMKIRDEIQ